MVTKQESTVKVPPSQVKFWDTTFGKTLRAAIYISLSGALAYLIAAIQNEPNMFGIYTALINVLLVAIKNGIDPNVKNI